MIVVDTNVVSYLLIEGDDTERARGVWRRDPEWRAPPLWRAEFLNVLWMSVRAGVISGAQSRVAWINATGVLAGKEVEPTGERVLDVALRDGITAYDAQFVAVAESLGVQLVSADRKLCKACPKVAVPLATFGARG